MHKPLTMQKRRKRLTAPLFVCLATLVAVLTLVMVRQSFRDKAETSTVELSCHDAQNCARRVYPQNGAWSPTPPLPHPSPDTDAIAFSPGLTMERDSSTTAAVSVVNSKVGITAVKRSGDAPSVDEPGIFRQLRESGTYTIPPQIRKLAAEITQNATNDFQKARAIYDWLTENIIYDSEEWAHIVNGGDSYSHDHSPAAVVERGSTVCAGYSWLFNALCKSSGLQSTYIIGSVRGYRGTPDDELISAFKHSWSAVKIDGSWRLLDATWGARQAGETLEDAEERRNYYFLTDADELICDHLPEKPEWQLLDEPIDSKYAFSLLPNLKPSFFINGIKCYEPYTSVLRASSETDGKIRFSVPDGVEIAATLGLDNRADESVPIPTIRHNGSVSLIIPRQKSGRYILRLFSRTENDAAFDCSADFVLTCE